QLVAPDIQLHGVAQGGHLAHLDLHSLGDPHVHDPALHRPLPVELGHHTALAHFDVLQGLHTSPPPIMIRLAMPLSSATRLFFTCPIRLPAIALTTVTSVSTTKPISARCWRTSSFPVILRMVTGSPGVAIVSGIIRTLLSVFTLVRYS